MKITPVSSPADIKDTSTPEAVRTAKAVAAFNKGQSSYDKPAPQAQETPVANPNNISAEELSAIQPKQTSESDNIASSEGQTETEVEAPTKPEIDPETQRRFAQIARQEKALRAKQHQQDKAFKEREAQLAAREAALKQTAQPDLSNYIDKARIKQDALTVLEEAGVDWDNLTNQAMNRAPTDPRVMSTIQRLESKIAELENDAKSSKQSYAEQQQAQYQAAIKQIKTDAKQLVYTDPEFETVKAMRAVDDVVDLIEQTYKKDGIVLSVEEAAKEVENYLVEEALKVTQIDKIKKRMAAANASRPATQTKTQPQQQPQMKTLTNANSSQRPLTTRERAIAAMEGRLKS